MSEELNKTKSIRSVSLSVLFGIGRYRRALTTFLRILLIYGQEGWDAADKSKAHTKSAKKLVLLCEQNGVTWIKAAQFFSSRPDLLPSEYLRELQRLQDTVKPISLAAVSKQLEKTWGKGWLARFSYFSPEPVATASIAQVHKAQLISGEWVAVKVLLPSVRRIFEQDSLVFEWAAGVLAPLVKEVDTQQITQQLLGTTRKELDFSYEASHHELFEQCAHIAGVRVPKLYKSLSTSEVLVTEWVEGVRLRDYLAINPDKAELLLQRLFTSYFQQVTEFGIFQADPHPGNFLVDEDDNIVILDFGAMGTLTTQETKAYQALFMGLIQNNLTDYKVSSLFQQAGFVGGQPQRLRELATYMLTNRLATESPWLAMQNIMALLRAEKIEIPNSYISISRVLITLGGLLQLYQVLPPWQE